MSGCWMYRGGRVRREASRASGQAGSPAVSSSRLIEISVNCGSAFHRHSRAYAAADVRAATPFFALRSVFAVRIVVPAFAKLALKVFAQAHVGRAIAVAELEAVVTLEPAKVRAADPVGRRSRRCPGSVPPLPGSNLDPC